MSLLSASSGWGLCMICFAKLIPLKIEVLQRLDIEGFQKCPKSRQKNSRKIPYTTMLFRVGCENSRKRSYTTNYFKPGLPYLDGLIIHIIRERPPQRAAFVAHRVNMTNPTLGMDTKASFTDRKKKCHFRPAAPAACRGNARPGQAAQDGLGSGLQGFPRSRALGRPLGKAGRTHSH
jgi:hypothetical protein